MVSYLAAGNEKDFFYTFLLPFKRLPDSLHFSVCLLKTRGTGIQRVRMVVLLMWQRHPLPPRSDDKRLHFCSVITSAYRIHVDQVGTSDGGQDVHLH